MRVVITGATGYVGSRLVPELIGRGHEVVAATSSPIRPERFSWGRDVDWVPMDARDPEQVRIALRRTDAVCYLVHSLTSRSFETDDALAAAVVREAVDEHAVSRVVYLSGLIPDIPRDQLSAHLRSRLEVEEILAGSDAATLALRAGIVLGAGSTSFEIMRQVSSVLPVQVLPPWMHSRIQPISVLDVVRHLADALERDDVTGHLDVGAPEVLSYADLMAIYARSAGLPRLQLTAPPTPAVLVSSVAPLACAAPWWTVASLVVSLQHDMVCDPLQGDPLSDGQRMLSVAEAIRRSLRHPAYPDEATTYGGDPHVLAPSDPDWTQPPRWSGHLPGVPRQVEGMLSGITHIAEHRLRGVLGR